MFSIEKMWNQVINLTCLCQQMLMKSKESMLTQLETVHLIEMVYLINRETKNFHTKWKVFSFNMRLPCELALAYSSDWRIVGTAPILIAFWFRGACSITLVDAIDGDVKFWAPGILADGNWAIKFANADAIIAFICVCNICFTSLETFSSFFPPW